MPPRRKKPAEENDTATPTTTRARRTSARQKDASNESETISEISSRKRKNASDYQEDNKTKKKARGVDNSAAPTKKLPRVCHVRGYISQFKRDFFLLFVALSPLAVLSSKSTRSDDGADGGTSTSKAKTSRKSKGTAPVTSDKFPQQLFDTYAEANGSEILGAEGLEKLFGEANIPIDGSQPLLLAWQLNAKELGSFSRDEWMKGLQELQIMSLESLAIALLDLEELIVLRKPPPPKPKAQSISKGIKSKSAPPPIDKYKKDRYWNYAANVNSAFLEFYNFCFALVRKEGSRSIEMDYASAFWSVILAPRYPIMAGIIEFINEKGTYKGVNKDLWSMMYEFCQSVSPSLEGYDSEGAWPSLLDDFAEWKLSKAGTSGRESASERVSNDS